ncbi:ABC transporter ATP-binding protein [Candidatus Poribacteria bacterium]|nr:ABC transporter ATP-binding protein [Candidatus Poribacteria bacterium]MYB64922.1 ABC transporter ATP-binding protein [Candidatus Poribacteria bacterium]
MKDTAIVQTQNLSKWYGEVMGVNDVTLTIQHGITGLLGPNGAGKTSLLKLMTGQLKPNKGHITVLNEPVWNNFLLTKRIGYCPDIELAYQFMTGFEFVEFFATLNGYEKNEIRNRTIKALETVDMTSAGNRQIGSYSKGMRQRIKLAQALVHDPELLFLDEPLTGLDPIGRRHIINLLAELTEQGISIVVSSHILYEIEAMTETILLIHQGRILAEGTISDIRELIDEHPHKVYLNADEPRRLAQTCLPFQDILSVTFGDEEGDVIIETAKPDVFYDRLPKILIENELKVSQLYSPDDNLSAVFKYLVG